MEIKIMKTKICTDIDQSERLIALGIDVNTADMFWLTTDKPRLHILVEDLKNYSRWDCMPAWSFSALLGLIPNSINFGYYNDSTFVLKKIENGNYIADYYEVSFVKDNPLDAAFEMVVWLKENGKI